MTALYSEHSVERSLTEQLQVLSTAIAHEHPLWAETLARFAAEAAGFETRVDSWQEKYSFGRQVKTIYGGMGSLNDVTFSSGVEEQKTLLYQTVKDYLRLCWKQLGRPWYHVADKERFQVGDRVVLVHGEVISLDRRGEPSRAPKSDLVYTVVEQYSNDIDNMALYLVSSGSRFRVAP